MAETPKIGDAAELVGTTIRAIRYYEEEGLLRPLRTEGGTRLYTPQHLIRLRAILHLIENGFSVESVRVLATLREQSRTGDESQRHVGAELKRKQQEIASRILELQRLSGEIEQARQLVGQCRGCRNRPDAKGCPTCPLKGLADKEALVALIWDQEQ